MNLNLICPETATKFLNTLTCDTRRVKAKSNHAVVKYANSYFDFDACKTCTGPVPISEYKPKPKKIYADPPPAVGETTIKIEREKRPYTRGTSMPSYKLDQMMRNEKRILECPKYLKVRSLKSRLQKEAGRLRGRKYKIELLCSAVRITRQV